MVQKRVRRTAIGIGVTGAVIIGVAFALSRLNVGEKVVGAAGGLGSTVGQVITKPFEELIKSFTEGGAAVVEEGGKTGAGIQEFFTGNRDAIADFFSGKNQDVTPANPKAGRTSNVSPPRTSTVIPTITSQPIDVPIESQSKPSGFGGFMPSIFRESSGFRNSSSNVSLPKVSQLEKKGFETTSRPVTLTQFGKGISTKFALPPALEGLRGRLETDSRFFT